MPLSEQEQRLLDEMERQLMHNDADVVHASTSGTLSYRNLLIGAVLVLLGLTGVIVGIALWSVAIVVAVIVGVVGFAAMVVGVIVGVSPGKGSAAASAGGQHPQTPAPSNESFMDKMNDRWDRRHQG